MKLERNTPQRQLIRDLLRDNYDHPTANEVYQMAKEYHPAISQGTVYRNLNLLAENGEICRLSMPVGPDHYDCQGGNHYHFVCRQCHKTFDTHIPYDSNLNLINLGTPGFKTEWHRFVLVGLCPACNHETS